MSCPLTSAADTLILTGSVLAVVVSIGAFEKWAEFSTTTKEGMFAMKNTTVITSLLLVVLVAVFAAPAVAAEGGGSKEAGRQFFELRIYTFSSADQHAVVENYWEKAAIPALGRLGIGPVGVFKEIEAAEGIEVPRIVVLIPYDKLVQFVNIEPKLKKDKDYLKAAKEYYSVDKEEPAYTRIESNLLHAMVVMPTLKAPNTDKPRIFEMREYQGHSEKANDLKISMFNDGEADIFAESGLTGVFYSKTVIGKNRPSLFYMVTFDDMADHEKDWGAFRENPRWAEIRKSPKYEGGGVSDRSIYMLEPMACSQI
jgi:hypothetical protein